MSKSHPKFVFFPHICLLPWSSIPTPPGFLDKSLEKSINALRLARLCSKSWNLELVLTMFQRSQGGWNRSDYFYLQPKPFHDLGFFHSDISFPFQDWSEQKKPPDFSLCISAKLTKFMETTMGTAKYLGGHISGRVVPEVHSLSLFPHRAWKSNLCLLKSRVPNNWIYSRSVYSRELLKFLSGRNPSWRICSLGNGNSYTIGMAKPHVWGFSFYFSTIKLKLEQLRPCKGRFATHSHPKAKYLFKGCWNRIPVGTN